MIEGDNTETYKLENLFYNFAQKYPTWSSTNFRILRRKANAFSRGISLDLGSDIPKHRDANEDGTFNPFLQQPEQAISSFETESNSKASITNFVKHSTFKLKADSLLFLCDIDVIFNQEFIKNVQNIVQLNRQVYFPIIFSEYDKSKPGYNDNILLHEKFVVGGNYENPDIPRAISGAMSGASFADQPENRNNLPIKIKESTGCWREYGYGLAAMYQSDLISVGSFDTHVQGWGLEDVDLYSRFVANNQLSIFRSKNSNIQHIYHPQFCDDKFFQNPEKYQMCMKSKSTLYSSSFELFNTWHDRLGFKIFR